MSRTLDSVAGPPEPISEIDLRAIGSALKRRRRAWLLPTAAAFLGVALFVTVATPRYTAQTQILLENQETFFTRPDRVNLPNEVASQLDEAAVASQVQLIASPDIARRAIQALHLAGNDEFDPLANGMNPLKRLLVVIGLLPDPTRDTAEARMVQTFEQRLTVFSPPKTRVVTVEFTSRDPELAARAANAVADLYLAEQSSAKRGMAKGAAEALSAQIVDLRSKLAGADAERERYRLSTGLLAGTNNMTISGQQLAEINTDLSRARATQADAQAKAATIRDLLKGGHAADVADVTNNPTVRQIWQQRSVAQAQLATEARTLLPGHPRVKELTAQLKEYDASLKSAAKQAAMTLENDARIAGQRVANLEAALTQQKKLAGVANGDEVHLNALDRIAQGFKDQLQSSTTKYEEALARQTSTATPADARVISRAAPPQEPSYPKKLAFLVFGTLATLVFSVGYVIATEIFSGRAIGDPDSVPVARKDEHQGDLFSEAEQPRRRTVDVREPVAIAARRRDTIEQSAAEPPLRADRSSSPERVPKDPKRFASRPRELLDRLVATSGEDELVLAPVASRKPIKLAKLPKAMQGMTAPRRWAEARFAAIVTYLSAFGRSAVESRLAAEAAEASSGKRSAAATKSISFWDDDPAYAPVAEPVAGGPLASDDLQSLAARILAGHVPGRGMHIVGTGVGGADVTAAAFIDMARVLADKGRSIIVDLNTVPTRLGPLGRDAEVAALDGLSELLAGEASFAEVIHRDHASRLHFIPTGRKEADFRDFDLILDALTETYDFIVLLTPSYPQSEIAKVMAPYAEFVVLTAARDGEAAVLTRLESELTAAGAREVLVAGAPVGEERRRVVA